MFATGCRYWRQARVKTVLPCEDSGYSFMAESTGWSEDWTYYKTPLLLGISYATSTRRMSIRQSPAKKAIVKIHNEAIGDCQLNITVRQTVPKSLIVLVCSLHFAREKSSNRSSRRTAWEEKSIFKKMFSCRPKQHLEKLSFGILNNLLKFFVYFVTFTQL